MSAGANFGLGLRTREPQALHTPAYLENFTVSPCDPQIWDRVKQQKSKEVQEAGNPSYVCEAGYCYGGLGGKEKWRAVLVGENERNKSLKGKKM